MPTRSPIQPTWTCHIPEPERQAGAVVDLMSALEQSLQKAGRTRPEASTDYSRMTKTELYELAQERDLPGRSDMSKVELVEALEASDEQAAAA